MATRQELEVLGTGSGTQADAPPAETREGHPRPAQELYACAPTTEADLRPPRHPAVGEALHPRTT